MLLSKSCEYGLRATLYLASLDDDTFTSIRQISDKLDISYHFLTKILQQLTAKGLLESFKGPNGGVKLAKSGKKIQLLEIVEAIDGGELFTECVLGLPGCGMKKPCALHDKWMNRRNGIKDMMESTSLSELSEQSISNCFRITADKGLEEL
ncbi:MAG TPA: Rrf2 family transcriptional regulator [Balneolaceae bacterium]|nr:Rrf2 family transcriptional regulator [Balneolaceae bacterium]